MDRTDSTLVTQGPVGPREVDPVEVGSVALAVRDLDRVARFYEQAVGLTPLSTEADGLWLGAGGGKLLYLRERPDLRAADPAAAGLFHTAFLLPSRDDLGRWLRHAAQIRLTIEGAADHLVSEAVYLTDPEGNGIEIYADRPRETWRWTDGKIEMANDRLDLAALMALDPRPWSGAPDGTLIGHVHLQVGEIEAAERFYTGPIGLVVTRQWPQALFMSGGLYHHRLAANTWRSAGAGPRDPGRAGLEAITLRLAGPARSRETLQDPWGTTIHLTHQGDES